MFLIRDGFAMFVGTWCVISDDMCLSIMQVFTSPSPIVSYNGF